MTDRGIIFSAPMVRALIEGRKTQTRRKIKEWRYGAPRLPYMPGDRLYVREAWKPGAWRDDGRVAVDYRASLELTNTPWIGLPESAEWPTLWEDWTREIEAAGSRPDEDGMHHWKPGKSPMRWRPSIHMPRWTSRLTLTVTGVRVQQLQEISEADARAEGIKGAFLPWPQGFWTYRPYFADLWNSLHGPDAWDQNPWVVAVSFTVRKGNIDA